MKYRAEGKPGSARFLAETALRRQVTWDFAPFASPPPVFAYRRRNYTRTTWRGRLVDRYGNISKRESTTSCV
jgi:hypothetical protein